MVDRLLTCVPEFRPCLERRWRKTASRDREKCIVFSSITAANIPADHELRGTRMLRALLDFAETGKLAPVLGHGRRRIMWTSVRLGPPRFRFSSISTTFLVPLRKSGGYYAPVVVW